jgi:hypothetical protein
MTKNMPLREFCEWYVYFYELNQPNQPAQHNKHKDASFYAKTPEEEIAFLKSQFS